MPIKNLNSPQLLSAIHAMERVRLDEMATRTKKKDIEFFSEFPIAYRALVKEAQKRGLIFRGEFTKDNTGLVLK